MPFDAASYIIGKNAGGGSSVQVDALDVTANGTYTAESGHAYNLVTVNVSGGGSASDNDVRFLDYDGSVVYSYSASDFAALTAMPDNPTHEGLTSQGWNWSLADAKSYVADYGMLDIGQMYITDDGKTRLYIRIATTGRMDVPVYFSQTVANGVTINWGDGSADETFAGTGNITSAHHVYANIGNYVITLDPAEGCTLGLGTGQSNTCVMGSYSDMKVYANMLQSVYGGAAIHLAGNAFQNCSSLTSITIPNTATSIASSLFSGCSLLARITIPNTVTSIGSSVFQSCFSLTKIIFPNSITKIFSNVCDGCILLTSITLPNTVTSIASSAFQSCFSLTRMTFPNTVTSIASKVFASSYSMAEYYMLPETPPTIQSDSLYVPADCKIYVPYSADHSILNAYKTATNWSNYASYMEEMPE